MNDPDKECFENYARHYLEMGVRERLPDDLERIKRDRLPRWLDEVTNTARILDAGCGRGHLLAALNRTGYSNLVGIEISAAQLAAAQRLLPESTTLEQTDVISYLQQTPDASFDVIFFHDVLEHLPRKQTIEVLRLFYHALRTGGRLQIRVPNSAVLIGSYFHAIDFTHVTHFTEFSLLQVVEAAGFDVSRVQFDSQAPRLFWSWSKPQRALFRLLNHLRWRFNDWLHRGFFFLADMHPQPRIFDNNLLLTVFK
jgi:2-polyprenyl-3-methyl-5-hydroxy-6-metoxy-1,4-benzoquinol methylase